MAAVEAVEAVSVIHAARQPELIREGLSVLLDVNNEKQSFAVVKKNHRVRVGSAFVALDPLIGASFGSVFEVITDTRGGQFLARLVNSSPSSGTAGEAVQAEEDRTESTEPKVRDNRQLVDNNTAQGLSAEEIEVMKRQGAKGDEIIKALVANSTTFASKTEFSQEKYMRKKQKKYAPQLIVRRPSARSVCEAYFTKTPMKTGFLRVDSLALMLGMANVGAYADVLVLDYCGGLPTAAIAERLGGYGSICSTYRGDRPPSIDILRLLNLDAATAASVTRTSISTLVADRAAVMETGKILDSNTSVGLNCEAPLIGFPSPNVGTDVVPGGKAEDLVQLAPKDGEGKAVTDGIDGSLTFSAVKDVEMGEATEGEGDRDKSKTGQVKENEATNTSGGGAFSDEGSYRGQSRKKKRGNTEDGTEKERPGRPSSLELRQRWAQRGFTSLVVAALHISPSAAAQSLLPLLAPSSSFAIYHTYLQPLAECMHKLQKEKLAVALQLSESWLREYQVLPERSHPLMQMSATGGYLLHGITVNQMSEKKLTST